MSDDAHGATRHLIAREVLYLLVQSTARFNSEVSKWDEDGNAPKVLVRMAWRFADAFVAESVLLPHERAALVDPPTDKVN